MQLQYRQGDLLFQTITKAEFDGMRSEAKPYTSPVMAYGEVTGHSHAIADTLDGVDMLVDKNGDIYLSSTKEITIDHEEHGAITLPPGEHRVTRQEEYDWATQARTKVAD